MHSGGSLTSGPDGPTIDIATSHLRQNCCMEEEWCRIYLSQHGMAVARDVKFALASTSDRTLSKNAMTLVVSQTWQNFHVDITSEHMSPGHPQMGTWSYCRKCLQPRSYKIESASGSVLRRNRRDTRETAEKHVFLSNDDA